MISRVAAVITLLNDQFSSPQMAGISPVPLPSDAGDPYVTVQEILAQELESLTGQSGMARSTIQVNVWSHDYEVAYALREAIKSYLFGFSGSVGGSPPDAVIGSVNHRGDRELQDGSIERHQLISRFLIWWEA